MVTAVSSNNTTAAVSSAGSLTSAADMQNQFLTLLVAQLQNQDPLNPVDNAQMTSQMAQISTVSGIEKLNNTVENVTGQFNMMQMLQGTNMIGRMVLTEGNTMAVGSDNKYSAAYDLSGPASNVKVQITTAAGALVDTMDMGTANDGRNYFTWDGAGYNGDPSQLRFSVVATNGEQVVSNTALAPQSVVAASVANGTLMLELGNGSSMAYSDIKAVY